MTRASHSLLASAVDRERRRATVRSLDMSFNELADMYKTGELHIVPAYQRTFRWSEAKQSRFIESIVLEMPVPPIYAVEVGEGRWELIDGLQRLSTYLHLRSLLDLPDHIPPIAPEVNRLTLSGCDIVPELNGYVFDDLTTSLQYRIRRATLRLELVRQESNPRFAYYMFKRLNTGGEPLSDQEARNCSIRLLDEKFNNFLLELKSDDNFQICISDITDEYRMRMGEEELVLRFFAFKNNMDNYVHDIDPFLTDFMERVTDTTGEEHIPFDYERERKVFRKVFGTLAKTLGSATGRRHTDRGYAGGFSVSHYESFSLGVARVIDDIPDEATDQLLSNIKNSLDEAKKDPFFRDLTKGGGKNFRRIYDQKIQFVADRVKVAL